MRKILIVAICTGLGVPALYAQTDTLWTLDRCVEYAVKYNLDMKRQELMPQSATQDVKQSKLDLLPNLNGSFEHQLGSGTCTGQGHL